MTLELTGVERGYAGFEFGPIDLRVGREVLAVLGPSGSGKTTLLSAIAGMVSLDSGSVSLDGRTLDGRPLEERNVGVVFQDGALFPHMTARENVAYAASDGDRVRALAEFLEIDDVLDRRPAALSGGERQRVALARTLAADPDALLLDEPLSSLDAPIRRRLRGELHGLFDDLEIPVVYVTHDQRTATALGDRIAVLRDGAVEQVGSPSAVIERPGSRFVARFTGTENVFEATAAGRTGDGTTVRIGDRRLRTTASAADIREGAVSACVHPSRVELLRPGGAEAGEANTLRGTVDRWLNEGEEYRVFVEVDGLPDPLTAAVRPGAFDRLGITGGTEAACSVPADAVHLIDRTDGPER